VVLVADIFAIISMGYGMVDMSRAGSGEQLYANFAGTGGSGGAVESDLGDPPDIGEIRRANTCWRASLEGRLSVVQAMLALKANPNYIEHKMLPLFNASQNNHPDVVGVLIAAGANLNMGRTADGLTILTPLLVAVQLATMMLCCS
jgi:hypothetical protein